MRDLLDILCERMCDVEAALGRPLQPAEGVVVLHRMAKHLRQLRQVDPTWQWSHAVRGFRKLAAWVRRDPRRWSALYVDLMASRSSGNFLH